MHFSLCENNKMIVFPDLIEEYIAHGATSVVLSDAIFCKKAMSERNFKVIRQLSHTATSRAKDALCRYIYILFSFLLNFSEISLTLIADCLRHG